MASSPQEPEGREKGPEDGPKPGRNEVMTPRCSTWPAPVDGTRGPWWLGLCLCQGRGTLASVLPSPAPLNVMGKFCVRNPLSRRASPGASADLPAQLSPTAALNSDRPPCRGPGYAPWAVIPGRDGGQKAWTVPRGTGKGQGLVNTVERALWLLFGRLKSREGVSWSPARSGGA